ncbi:MAG: winged helix-turn-helix transcriptional regulator [Sphingobium sp.]
MMLILRHLQEAVMLQPVASPPAGHAHNQLRELKADGLVLRKLYAEAPLRVEYSLSDRGRTLPPILAALKNRGDENIDLFTRRLEAASPDSPEKSRLTGNIGAISSNQSKIRSRGRIAAHEKGERTMVAPLIPLPVRADMQRLFGGFGQ